ncbi:MAG: transcription-repair coupling factor [Thermodesulfobacteriota bacterium]
MPRDGRNSGGQTSQTVAPARNSPVEGLSLFASDPGNRIGTLAQTLRNAPADGEVEVSGLAGGSAFLIACLISKHLKTRLLYIANSSESCARAVQAIAAFTGEEPPVAGRDTVSFAARAKNAQIVCSTFEDAARKIVHPSLLESVSLSVKAGQKIERDIFAARLREMGYEDREFARLEGEMSVRGAIVDVAGAGGETPLRVEFSGGKIRSMRLFSPQSQMSTEQAVGAHILPAGLSGTGGGEAEASVFDYCGGIVFVEQKNDESAGESLGNAASAGAESDTDEFFSAEEMEQKIAGRKKVLARSLNTAEIDFKTSPVPPGGGETSTTAGKILNAAKLLKREGYGLKLFLSGAAEAEKMREIFASEGVSGAEFHTGTAGGGFIFPDMGTAFIDERDFTEKIPAAKTPADEKLSPASFESAFGEMKDGDLVVHREFGIAIFRGLKNLSIRGAAGDFIECEYQGGDSVYVPVSKFKLLHKYSGGDESKPKIDKLGGVTWRKTVKGAKKATETMARELLELYASRKSVSGHRFSPPDAEFREFEMGFMFEETPEQKKAIEDVMRDMESPRPMDRLICGDTGFGKTEVALRAAVKAAMDGFQVAFITPTTLLVSQHIKTAKKRLGKFPVNAVAFSRFNTQSESKKILEEIERGTADIVIGTHKLLGGGVRFKNLGLLIIDEEHKFGVRHKEKLKTMKENLEVLSLSATPIPRTLQLSLAGMRDISPISTPPRGRLPVKIQIKRWNKNLIRDLISRETDRGGGVFFIHNRIENIGETAKRLEEISPGVSIEITHGRTGKKDLESRIERFARGEVDMLVTTAIVESGLDITRANTIIVNDSHKFGVADLYQLKGRVGRGSEQAYACLLVPEKTSPPEEAWRRLRRFAELWDFGSGYELAFSDLRMRGVGNLFGVEQSGHITGVGVEFYMEMLREAVESLKTGRTEKMVEPEIKINTDARIPGDYVANNGERLVFYRRISSSSAIGEVNKLKKEMADRFGPPPARLKNLLALAALKIVLKKHSVGFMEIKSGEARAYTSKDRAETVAKFSESGGQWRTVFRKGISEKAAGRAARLLSSIKSV